MQPGRVGSLGDEEKYADKEEEEEGKSADVHLGVGSSNSASTTTTTSTLLGSSSVHLLHQGQPSSIFYMPAADGRAAPSLFSFLSISLETLLYNYIDITSLKKKTWPLPLRPALLALLPDGAGPGIFAHFLFPGTV